MTFPKFHKIPRWSNDTFTITEKIDGTNGLIYIHDWQEQFPYGDAPETAIVGTLSLFVGSRKRWITPKDDNFGFADWVGDNAEELVKLGAGHHYGEWHGSGIQRGYGLQNGEKRFALFNVHRWLMQGALPTDVVDVVPLFGQYDAYELAEAIDSVLDSLRVFGSAINHFHRPEGIVIYSAQHRTMWKRLLENDDVPKFVVAEGQADVFALTEAGIPALSGVVA